MNAFNREHRGNEVLLVAEADLDGHFGAGAGHGLGAQTTSRFTVRRSRFMSVMLRLVVIVQHQQIGIGVAQLDANVRPNSITEMPSATTMAMTYSSAPSRMPMVSAQNM